MNGKVLDIESDNSQSGAKVLMYDQKDPSAADNQLWFEDRYGNIRSKLNPRLVLDSSGKLIPCRPGLFEKNCDCGFVLAVFIEMGFLPTRRVYP